MHSPAKLIWKLLQGRRERVSNKDMREDLQRTSLPPADTATAEQIDEPSPINPFA